MKKILRKTICLSIYILFSPLFFLIFSSLVVAHAIDWTFGDEPSSYH